MSWQINPNDGHTYMWVDDGQGDPSQDPNKTGRSPTAAPALTPEQQQGDADWTRRRLDPNSGDYVGDGYQAVTGSNGRPSLRLVDPQANAMWKAKTQTQQPAAVGQAPGGAPLIDPATGRPVGQAPAQPQAPGQRASQTMAGMAPSQPPRPAAPAVSQTQRQAPVGAPQAAAGGYKLQQPPAEGGGSVPAAALGQHQVDRTQYDQAAQGLQQARNDFYEQLNRLAGVDPFGNQAFLQKATDRAVAQASGTAAGARGGASAIAGAQRQAQGVQAQLSARGAQDVAEQGRRDAVQAAQLGIQTVGGIADVNSQLAQNELQLINQAEQAAALNLQGYLGGRELDARERESIRQLATEVSRIDMQRYQTDMNYRAQVDANLTERYKSDQALSGVLAQVEAQESLSGGELLMGVLGMGAGLGAAAIKSDRRTKFDVQDPDARDLKDYLGGTRGKLYRYKEPHRLGRKPGLNFGPMAQDLMKSKIGQTIVRKDNDGTLSVDTGRLALADHAALAELAREVEKLKSRKGAK